MPLHQKKITLKEKFNKNLYNLIFAVKINIFNQKSEQNMKSNTYNENIYEDLMKLVENNEAFFFKDFTLDDKVYRIFNYHLASWTLFQEAGALNCRGIMFDITDENKAKLVSLPPEKFFNYEEGGVDHTLGYFGDKMVKMDGSLISTYFHNDDVYLKSKGSLFSEQAVDVMKFLNSEEQKGFKAELLAVVKQGFTVNLEYTAPHNRIVIPYQTEDLTVLSMRDHKTGENYFASKLKKFLEENNYTELLKHLVEFVSLHAEQWDHQKFVDMVRNEQNGEGYVVEIITPDDVSYLVKIKNLKYVALHQTKDSVNSPRRLFEAIINEASDDLRAMFNDDEYVLGEIAKMENHVQPIYNHIIKTVETFVQDNFALSRKDFAIKANKEQPEFMGLIMNEYLLQKSKTGEIEFKAGKDGVARGPKPNNYKEFAIKNRKELFGIGEDPELDEDGNPVRTKKLEV